MPSSYRKAAERLLAFRATSIATIAPMPSGPPRRLPLSAISGAYRFRRKQLTDAEQAAQLEAEGRPFALRFQVPPGRTLVLHDLIKGDVEFSTDEIGDFVIVRPDGSPLYNFASVVDDIAMEITHVVRADEHISNTFPQLLIFEALGGGLPPVCPSFLTSRSPGRRRRCRSGSSSSTRSRAFWFIFINTSSEGYLPDAVVNYLARLGWSYDASQEIFARQELIEKFTLEKVNSSPASHDQDKLFWIEGEWMKTLPLEQKVAGVVPFLKSEGLVEEPLSTPEESRIKAVIEALGDRLKVFSDILKLGRYFFFPGADLRARSREETAAEGRRCRDADGARLVCWRKSSRLICRLWRRPCTTTPYVRAARWVTWSTRCEWLSRGRGSVRALRLPCHPGA